MKLKTGLSDNDVYTKAQLKRLLIDHYGDEVSITSIRQQGKIVTLTSNVKHIIQEAHTKAANVYQSNMDQLFKIVGVYIRTEIKKIEKHYDLYPDTEQMKFLDANIDYVQHRLRTLLQSIIKSKNGIIRSANYAVDMATIASCTYSTKCDAKDLQSLLDYLLERNRLHTTIRSS